MIRTPPFQPRTLADTPLPETPDGETKSKANDTKNSQNATKAHSRPLEGELNNVTLTPLASRFSPDLEEMSNEEIMIQIKNLQKLLDRRLKKKSSKKNLFKDASSSDDASPSKSSPIDMDTSFCSTASLVRGVQTKTGRKRKGSSSSASSPARRIKVTAQINRADSDNDGPMIESFPPLRRNSKAITAQLTQAAPPVDGAANPQAQITSLSGSQVRRYPALPSRPQRAQPTSGVPSQIASGNDTGIARQEQPAIEKIPPIILRDKSQWAKVSSTIKKKGINFSKAQNIADGIRIFPASEADFRALSKYFSNEAIPFHTYQLPSEKLLNVVLRSVPIEIREEDIYNDLVERGLAPECVIRMRRARDKAPMPLVLVKIDKKYKNIYHLKEVVSLDISVESLKSRPTVGQCFRCQKFGHAQSRCSAQKKCVACAGDHDARDCPRPKSDPATCANCGEQHPANYRGCSRFPKPRAQTLDYNKPNTPSGPQSGVSHSYSQALSGARRRNQEKSPKPSRVSWRTNNTPSSDRHGSKEDDPEDAKVEKLMDVLQGLFVQIESVTKVIQQMFPKKTKKPHGAR